MDLDSFKLSLETFDFGALTKVCEEIVPFISDIEFNFLKDIYRLGNLFLEVSENYFDLIHKNWKVKPMPICADKLALSFFEWVSPDLAYRVQNMIWNEDYENLVLKIGGEMSRFSQDKNKIVIDSLNGTFHDVFSFIHEFVHKLELPYNQFSYVSDFMVESSTITFEFLFRYFVSIFYPQYVKQVDRCVMNRFCDIDGSAMAVLVYYSMIDIYKKYGKINADVVFDYVNSLPDSLLKLNLVYYLEDGFSLIVDEKDETLKEMGYLIGFFNGCDWYCRVKQDIQEKEKVLTFMHVMGLSDFEAAQVLKVFRNLDLPMVGQVKGNLIRGKKIPSGDGLELLNPFVVVDDCFIKLEEDKMERMAQNCDQLLNEVSQSLVKKYK